MQRLVSLLAVVAAMPSFGCAASARELELRRLRERVEAMQSQLARVDTQVADLQNQMFLVSDQLGRERADAEAARPPPHLQVVKLAPSGPTSATTPAPEVFDIELTGDEEPKRLAVTRVPPPAPIRRHDGAEAHALFNDALTAFREGKAQAASELFSRFVDRYPDHAHADKALYWMGESRFEAGALSDAVANFRRLLLRYPRSSKVPDALFRMGVSYERLGTTAEARQAFQDLVSNYPATALADLARARLSGDAGGAR